MILTLENYCTNHLKTFQFVGLEKYPFRGSNMEDFKLKHVKIQVKPVNGHLSLLAAQVACRQYWVHCFTNRLLNSYCCRQSNSAGNRQH